MSHEFAKDNAVARYLDQRDKLVSRIIVLNHYAGPDHGERLREVREELDRIDRVVANLLGQSDVTPKL